MQKSPAGGRASTSGVSLTLRPCPSYHLTSLRVSMTFGLKTFPLREYSDRRNMPQKASEIITMTIMTLFEMTREENMCIFMNRLTEVGRNNNIDIDNRISQSLPAHSLRFGNPPGI